VVVAAWGPFLIAIFVVKPGYFDIKEKYVPE
jgi:hypothetical protein